jgi:hypothetical protein
MTVRPMMRKETIEANKEIITETDELFDNTLLESFDSKVMDSSYKKHRALKIINSLMIYLQDDQD